MTALSKNDYDPSPDLTFPLASSIQAPGGKRVLTSPCLTAAICATTLFLLIAFVTQGSLPLSGEADLLHWLHRFASHSGDVLALWISASVTVLSVLTLARLAWQRAWQALGFILACVGGSALLALAAKIVFHRERPQLWEVVAHHSSYAFPSGHAVQSMALAVGVLILMSKQPSTRVSPYLLATLFVLVIVAVGAVAVARMYLGLHYPSQILAGWTLAIAWVSLMALLFRNAPLPLKRSMA
ncbi:phosphatase PAP2 family protein [uncultured Oxalicibacterium sp.]|uniref:phosphatase PAP2 family protein n=1 Tax=uncultured Oxalicibacterium sp. TaxID=1168540 RepID=UPI0025EC8B0E|nr:phosphatase PAP2 family protein [uncultured Oxalicibacterium sp.]